MNINIDLLPNCVDVNCCQVLKFVETFIFKKKKTKTSLFHHRTFGHFLSTSLCNSFSLHLSNKVYLKHTPHQNNHQKSRNFTNFTNQTPLNFHRTTRRRTNDVRRTIFRCERGKSRNCSPNRHHPTPLFPAAARTTPSGGVPPFGPGFVSLVVQQYLRLRRKQPVVVVVVVVVIV